MMTPQQDPSGALGSLELASGQVDIYRLAALSTVTPNVHRLPMTMKIFVENALRSVSGGHATWEHVEALARWDGSKGEGTEFPFLPARVLLQDFTGVPCVVDLAAMRSAVARLGGDPRTINPLIPADLVIDHSVQVDLFGSTTAFGANVALEYDRNKERYGLLRWAQQAFDNFRVVPPGTGIVHQVNLEYLASVVQSRRVNNRLIAFPDTVVGTDSHTTMINGLGVLGWGVGGIEAEAALLGQPSFQLTPIVVGVRLTGKLPEGATATDLVLTVTQLLRKHGVVEKYVEFYGHGLSELTIPDRATLANMSPEYGATSALFPVDDVTLRYLRVTGRNRELVDLIERYCKEQGLFRTAASPDPVFSETVELDLATIEPSLAGPSRPQDRVSLGAIGSGFHQAFPKQFAGVGPAEHAGETPIEINGITTSLHHGAVAIAAITSCTNTSNPMVMVGAGLVAKKAVERGLTVKPYVKTSLAPGSRTVTAYLEQAGLDSYLEALRFHLVGYGCTTCIGNSGLVLEPVAEAVQNHDVVTAAVLSGNRNFNGRINSMVRAQYLASPPLVVAYALAGTVDIDLTTEPIGQDPNGEDVFLKDIWPTREEMQQVVDKVVTAEVFATTYASVFEGDEQWRLLPVPSGAAYAWDSSSTYVQEPPFFKGLAKEPAPMQDIAHARVLAVLGDSVTTDHISPAGSIAKDGPAGQYLQKRGVTPKDFNTYGTRRGNHEVMMRGTFGSIRLQNALANGKEGNWTRYLPTGEVMSIFDAAMRYEAAHQPLIILAGKDYGMGSSRDWAAKGALLLGVRAVIAESFERIHRSNLIGMGVLPLQYLPGQTRTSLGLTGEETYSLSGLASLLPKQQLTVHVHTADGTERTFQTIVRIDGPVELTYYENGGVLPTVVRQLLQ